MVSLDILVTFDKSFYALAIAWSLHLLFLELYPGSRTIGSPRCTHILVYSYISLGFVEMSASALVVHRVALDIASPWHE